MAKETGSQFARLLQFETTVFSGQFSVSHRQILAEVFGEFPILSIKSGNSTSTLKRDVITWIRRA